MAIYPKATVRLISKWNQVAITRHRRFNIHVAVWDKDSIHDLFAASNDACSHFYVNKAGGVEQLIDTKYRSAADRDGNDSTISAETEGGRSSDPDAELFTAAQMVALAELWAWVRDEHDIMNKIATSTNTNVESAGLSWHRLGIQGNFAGRPGLASQSYEGGILYSSARGKLCPGDAKINQIPKIFALANGGKVDLPKVEAVVAQMVSPFDGRLTQHHGDTGGYRGHKGMDIAPPRPGMVGEPVYAAFAGTVKKTYTRSYPGNLRSTWAPGRTGNGMLVANPDGEGNGYNHIMPCVKRGQKVKAGQLIGHNDASGNQTAPHLHFELWASWKDSDSDYAPSLAFRKFGITPGSAPSHVTTAGTVKPRPSKPAKKGKSTRDDKNIQKALNYMGIDVGREDGVNGKWQKAGVKVFQKANGLVEDGNWGEKTQAIYEQNKRIQKALKKMGIYKGRIDGNDGGLQGAAVKAFQKGHGLVQDSDWGTKTQAVYDLNKRVQRALRKKGYNKQTVDGYIGSQTIFNVKHFQRHNNLVEDGDPGPITQDALGL